MKTISKEDIAELLYLYSDAVADNYRIRALISHAYTIGQRDGIRETRDVFAMAFKRNENHLLNR